MLSSLIFSVHQRRALSFAFALSVESEWRVRYSEKGKGNSEDNKLYRISVSVAVGSMV